jgi:endonuclease G
MLCHSSSRKVPVWVAHELRREQLGPVFARPRRFRSDRGLASAGASDADYRNSGFSRGHMAPVADFAWSEDAIRATFVLPNAVPQKQQVNASVRAHVEPAVRRLAARADAVYVITGPIFDSENPRVIGEGGVAVPDATFKVVLALDGNRRTMYAAIVANADGLSGGLTQFATSVDEVERRTGLDFFAELDDAEEQELEATVQQLPGR